MKTTSLPSRYKVSSTHSAPTSDLTQSLESTIGSAYPTHIAPSTLFGPSGATVYSLDTLGLSSNRKRDEPASATYCPKPKRSMIVDNSQQVKHSVGRGPNNNGCSNSWFRKYPWRGHRNLRPSMTRIQGSLQAPPQSKIHAEASAMPGLHAEMQELLQATERRDSPSTAELRCHLHHESPTATAPQTSNQSYISEPTTTFPDVAESMIAASYRTLIRDPDHLYPVAFNHIRLVAQDASTPTPWEITLEHGEHVTRSFKANYPHAEQHVWEYDYFPLKMDVHHVNEAGYTLKVTLWAHISPARLAHHQCLDTTLPWNNVELGLKNFQQVNNGGVSSDNARPDFLSDDTVQALTATVVTHAACVARDIGDYQKTLSRLDADRARGV